MAEQTNTKNQNNKQAPVKKDDPRKDVEDLGNGTTKVNF